MAPDEISFAFSKSWKVAFPANQTDSWKATYDIMGKMGNGKYAAS
jgi:hypothetical protein